MRPLEGIRILDFTHVLAGPFATRLMADMGADVIKVNSRTRVGGNAPAGPYYPIWNRNKRALALDMTSTAARDVAKQLAQKADVVIDNFSMGVLDRWELGYDDVSPINPRVIYVQMSGMGAGGPWSNFVTYAPTIHALAGLTYTTGVAGRKDIGIGFSYNDHQAGLHAATALLAAIEARNQTGEGQRVDLSQFEIGVGFLGPTLLDYEINGNAAEPVGNDLPYDRHAPHGCYLCDSPTSGEILDENWIAIACLSDEHWARLKEAMNEPEWACDQRFDAAEGRYQARRYIDERMNEWTTIQNARELMRSLQGMGVPAGIVQTGIDLVETDPQLKAADFIRSIELEGKHPGPGSSWADRLPIYFDKTPCEQYERARSLGEDNASILKDWLGIDEETVRKGEEEGYFT